VDAPQLVGVELQVVELACAATVLRVDVARSADAVVVEPEPVAALEQQLVAPARHRSARERQQRAPVERMPGRYSGRFQDRRREVHVADDPARATAGRDARPAHHQRHPDPGLVDLGLAAPDPVLAVEEAVVRGEDDERVLELPRVP